MSTTSTTSDSHHSWIWPALVIALIASPRLSQAEEPDKSAEKQAGDKSTEKSPALYCPLRPKSKKEIQKKASSFFTRAENAFKKEKNHKKAIRRFLCSLYMLEHDATVTNIKRVIKKSQNKQFYHDILVEYLELNAEGELNPQIEEIVSQLKQELGISEVEKEPEAEVVEEKTAPPPPPPPPKPCPPVPDISQYELQQTSLANSLKLFGLVSAGAGAASLLAGIVLQVLAITSDASPSTKDNLQVGAIAGFSAGAVIGGIGAAEIVIWSKKRKQTLSPIESPPVETSPKPETETSDDAKAPPAETTSKQEIQTGDDTKAPPAAPPEDDATSTLTDTPKNEKSNTSKALIIRGGHIVLRF